MKQSVLVQAIGTSVLDNSNETTYCELTFYFFPVFAVPDFGVASAVPDFGSELLPRMQDNVLSNFL